MAPQGKSDAISLLRPQSLNKRPGEAWNGPTRGGADEQMYTGGEG
jgi:hypothetical protein